MPAVKEIMAEETVRNMASLSILNARPDITPLVVAYADLRHFDVQIMVSNLALRSTFPAPRRS